MNGYLHESVVELESSQKSASLGPGERLRRSRESLGLTHADIADHLNLRISIIEALETNNYKQIPKLVFARGYLRAYAKLLKLPGNEIIEAFNKLEYPENPSVLPATPIRAGQKKAPKKEHSLLPWLALTIFIILFSVVGFWSSISSFIIKSSAATSETVSTVVNTAQEKSSESASAQSEGDSQVSGQSSEESAAALPDLDQIQQEK